MAAKGGLVRDSIADIETFRPASPGWPASIGMGGRLPSESAAGLRRNHWPLCVGLRNFSPLEREQLGINRVDVRGFRFEEFVKLVGFSHPNPDRVLLWDIYERITAGREAGLFAGLARALAAAKSLQEMSAMAARPAQDVLPFAEQQRFAQVSCSARSGAEKLVCFALPFRQKDAEEIFSDDNIGAPIRELLRLGLLRSLDDDLFEMHEAVRAGLEETIARNVRVAANEALAAWYGRQENIAPNTKPATSTR